MKSIVKRVVPTPMIRLAQAALRKLRHRNHPLRTRYSGQDNSVLQGCIAYNELGGYCVPSSSRHRPAARAIFSGQVWEPETIDFMSAHCKGGDIVHAGTYFGDFLPALSRACGTDGKVWAFEPNPENYRCASITIMLNHLQNVQLRNAGLGSEASRRSMMVFDEQGRSLGGGSTILTDGSQANDRQCASVEIVRVDDAVPSDRRVAILQLDVEGFEQWALTGAMETMKRSKPILILEILPDMKWLAENILCLGYRIDGKVHRNTILRME